MKIDWRAIHKAEQDYKRYTPCSKPCCGYRLTIATCERLKQARRDWSDEKHALA